MNGLNLKFVKKKEEENLIFMTTKVLFNRIFFGIINLFYFKKNIYSNI